MTKYCPRCKSNKALTGFYKGKASLGLQSYCKTCTDIKNAEYRHRYPDRDRKRQATYVRTLRGKLSTAKTAAKTYNREWSIPDEVFYNLVGQPCHYCGSKLDESGYSLDRKDNNTGYTVENSLPCCGLCNRTKSCYLTYDEMVMLMIYRRGRS